MKYCSNCGSEIPEGSTFCPSCGVRLGTAEDNPFTKTSTEPEEKKEEKVIDAEVLNSKADESASSSSERKEEPSSNNSSSYSDESRKSIQTAAFVFMILGTIALAFVYLFPLCWCVPMTMHYNSCMKNNQQASLGFAICSLLFVSPIAGILMVVDYAMANSK